MNETTLQLIESSKLVGLAGFSLLYGLGGINGKWKRRILGSLLLCALIVGFSLLKHTFHWAFLAYGATMLGALSIGYGADQLKEKILKRTRQGAFLALAALPIAIPMHAWLLLAVHFCMCVCICVTLGAFNPLNARSEETVIATVAGLLPLYMV